VRRAGAEVADVIYVTGSLGGPLAALRELMRRNAVPETTRERFMHPVARISEGMWLGAHGAHAMIDLSDGLVSDAGHLAAAGGVSLTIALERLPLWPGCGPLDAARSGEEYELLLAAPATLDTKDFARTFNLRLTAIGEVARVASGATPGVTFTRDGARVDLEKGYDHFSH
jgi:thiamine-monophosphate kinase